MGDQMTHSEQTVSGGAVGVADASFRAGFVAIVGQPNVGKSTLLNLILGEKLAIVSPKPQTTRSRLLGVLHLPGVQLALLDTPGLHRPSEQRQTLLNRYMIEEAQAAAADVDAILLVIDASRSLPEKKREKQVKGENGEVTLGRAKRPRSCDETPIAVQIDAADRFIVQQLAALGKPIVLALNKIDKCKDKGLLLPVLELWSQAHEFAAIVPTAALSGKGVDRLLGSLCRVLPTGPALFPDDMLTDVPERALAAERIREQLFRQTEQELPYATAVTIDAWEERAGKQGERKVSVISATIHVEKLNQKRIIIGHAGERIRSIGAEARVEIEEMLGCVVHLELFVRVDADWSRTERGLSEMGYRGTPKLRGMKRSGREKAQ